MPRTGTRYRDSRPAPTDDRRRIAEAIKSRREAKGWSQAILAEYAGITQQALSNIEIAKYGTSLASLTRIAEALGITVQTLMKGPR